ncbi:hypothetical protein RSOL_414500 [Rhizoctonia solani AG-3 Rhs1AP]|uniref:Uncharacterized protein n=2 Tax=Rhizoctonia solani AG-3 TaxID=1086053 RepID=A0A074S7C2_9AGAM|nr:hypothetical protein RSOL_414500 [Rhizoctonia solani AG-3 Rhs1AP]KEP55296.1 hypothetical protein V565_006690 [Rhizoctonia solani 123E]
MPTALNGNAQFSGGVGLRHECRSRRTRAPATGMGSGGYGGTSAPPRRRGFGLGGGRNRAGAPGGGHRAEPIASGLGMLGGTGMETGVASGMGMSPAGGRVPRVRTRDRIKQFLGIGRSRRAAARTVMY